MRTCDDCDRPPTRTLGRESITFATCDNRAHIRRFESRCRRRAAMRRLAIQTLLAWWGVNVEELPGVVHESALIFVEDGGDPRRLVVGTVEALLEEIGIVP